MLQFRAGMLDWTGLSMLTETMRSAWYTASTAVRYYAEWLDGEYVLLKHLIHGYDHSAVMQRALRFHALFGSTVVLSDAQLIDFRTPIQPLFLDRRFRAFLKQKQNFLALVADPIRGTKDEKFAIAMKGLGRLTDQANKPSDSFEEAVTRIAEPIFRAGSFDSNKFLNSRRAGKGHVGRVIKRFPQYQHELTGLLHALDHFSNSPAPDTTTASTGSPERYDTLLRAAQKDHNLVKDAQAKRIEEIIRIQEQHIPEAQHGRRAAIRKVLGTGKWHNEEWTPENLRLYLDIVHAWNCAINRNIAPEAGTLYESSDDIPFSRYQRLVTDSVDWFPAGPMPSAGLPVGLRRFLSWDPLKADWSQIALIVKKTGESAEKLQASLKTGSIEERADALAEHASKIGDMLTPISPEAIPEWAWGIAKIAAEVTKIVPSELVDVGQEALRGRPYGVALLQRRRVVNTLKKAGKELL
jgi:hypothetical protein